MKVIFSFMLTIISLSMGCNDKPESLPIGNSIAVYPNPATDVIYIGFNNDTQLSYAVYAFGTDGGLIFTEEDDQINPTYSIDIGDKPKGMYEVVVVKGGKKTRQRVIKI
jgi:hypothetical protein